MSYLPKWTALALVGCWACASPSGSPLTIPTPDKNTFEQQVYPILLRDCGFSECHGSTGRFFRVFGPGRLRLDPNTASMDPYAPATAAELQESYDRARSMLAGDDTGLMAPLLREPLSAEAGGAGLGHKGTDPYGNNVYSSTQDPRYQVIAAWALTAGVVTLKPQGTTQTGGTSP